jgi:hypothetical protein
LPTLSRSTCSGGALQPRRLSFSAHLSALQNLFRSDLRLVDAVADADALVGAADEVEARMGRQGPVELGDAAQVADGVFRHALVPAIDLGKLRVGLEAEDAVQFLEHRVDQAGIVEIPDQLFVMAAAHEDADENLIVGSAIKPFDGAVGRGVDPSPLGLGNDEAEPVQRDLDVLLAEGDRDGAGGA